MGERMRLMVDGEKYTIVMSEDGKLEALRYGEKWRSLVGDNLVLAMAQEIQNLRDQVFDLSLPRSPSRPEDGGWRNMTDREMVDNWNRDHETGRAVTFRWGGVMHKTVTRSSAILLDGLTPVICLDGIQGPCALERVTPYDGVNDIPDADRAGGGATCPDCGRELRDHPADLEHLGKGGIPFLTKLCGGRSVKL